MAGKTIAGKGGLRAACALLPVAALVFVAGCAQGPEPVAPAAQFPVPAAGPVFEEVRPLLQFRHKDPTVQNYGRLGEVDGRIETSAGVALGDYNNDGLLDIYLTSWPGGRLFRNDGNWRFTDVTGAARLRDGGNGRGAAWGDYNNDGCPDLYVANYLSPNQLYLNNCDGTFTEVAARAGVAYNGTTHSVIWGDYDRDGRLDLYLVNYYNENYDEHNPNQTGRAPSLESILNVNATCWEPNILFRNNGDGTFAEVTAQAGVGDFHCSLAAVFSDVNGDMWPDIYVANDYGRNTLYLNQGNSTFRDATDEAGVGYRGDGMSADAADYDGDLRPDILVTNAVWLAAIKDGFGLKSMDADAVREWTRQKVREAGSVSSWLRDAALPRDVSVLLNSGTALYRANPDGTWSDVARPAGVYWVEWGWSAPFLDYDNDGWLDIFAANGYRDSVVPAFRHLPNRLFHNYGNGTFEEIGAAAGVADTREGHGAAVGDLDNDGDLDIVVNYPHSEPGLYRNDAGNRNSWLRVHLAGSCTAQTPPGAHCSNRDAVGAKVFVASGATSRVQMGEVKAGRGFLSDSERTLHFGLGNSTSADLEVRWPSGLVERLNGVLPNQTLNLREGKVGPSAAGGGR